MNDELLAMLLDILIAQQTTGYQGMGGDIPYDDYGMQGTIGGLGAYDDPVMEDWADSGISGSGAGTGGNLESATRPYHPPPPMAGYSGGRPLNVQSEGIARALSALTLAHANRQQAIARQQRSRPQAALQGLFGAPDPSAPPPEAKPMPVAAPTPEPKNRMAASPQTQTVSRARPSAVTAARSIMQAGQGQRNAGTSYAGSRPSYPAPKPASKPVTNPRPVTRNTTTYSGTTARNTLRQAVKR